MLEQLRKAFPQIDWYLHEREFPKASPTVRGPVNGYILEVQRHPLQMLYAATLRQPSYGVYGEYVKTPEDAVKIILNVLSDYKKSCTALEKLFPPPEEI